MAKLDQLKFINAVKPQHLSPVLKRRNKLIKRLWEQIELAKAESAGNTFTIKRFKSIRDLEDNRKTVEIEQHVKPWWFIYDSGKLCLNIRYGTKIIKLAKDKSAIELASKEALVETLELVKSAVDAGELDQQIEAVSLNVKINFKN
jgi:hypothetical protein